MNRPVYLVVVLAAIVVITAPLRAAQDKPAQAAAQAKDAKPAALTPAEVAASIEGKWHITMPRMAGIAALSVLDLKLNGKKLTGTLQSVQMGEIPVKGEFQNGKIKFEIEVDMGPQSLYLDFEGKLKDGELAGIVTLGPMGEFDWKGVRPGK